MSMKSNEKYEFHRKFREYEMKIIKMAGYLSDYYIDRAIESDDFSNISSFLIDYFSGPAGKPFDIGYLVSKYKEFGLNERVEDMDFNIDEWYKVKYELDKSNSYQEIYPDQLNIMKMSEEEYIDYLIEKREKEKDQSDEIKILTTENIREHLEFDMYYIGSNTQAYLFPYYGYILKENIILDKEIIPAGYMLFFNTDGLQIMNKEEWKEYQSHAAYYIVGKEQHEENLKKFW